MRVPLSRMKHLTPMVSVPPVLILGDQKVVLQDFPPAARAKFIRGLDLQELGARHPGPQADYPVQDDAILLFPFQR